MRDKEFIYSFDFVVSCSLFSLWGRSFDNRPCAYAVTKISPRNSLIPDQAPSPNDLFSSSQPTAESSAPNQPTQPTRQTGLDKSDTFKPPTRAGACRVCLKSFKADDFSITCYECQQRVCEDCASYSKLDVNEDKVGIL